MGYHVLKNLLYRFGYGTNFPRLVMPDRNQAFERTKSQKYRSIIQTNRGDTK